MKISCKQTMHILKMKNIDEIKKKVVERFIPSDNIAGILFYRFRDELVFHIFLDTCKYDREVMMGFFKTEHEIHELYPNNFFGFRYLYSGSVPEEYKMNNGFEVLYEDQPVKEIYLGSVGR